MPLYEYECLDCGTVFCKLVKEGTDVSCPHCGYKTRKLISLPASRYDHTVKDA